MWLKIHWESFNETPTREQIETAVNWQIGRKKLHKLNWVLRHSIKKVVSADEVIRINLFWTTGERIKLYSL